MGGDGHRHAQARASRRKSATGAMGGGMRRHAQARASQCESPKGASWVHFHANMSHSETLSPCRITEVVGFYREDSPEQPWRLLVVVESGKTLDVALDCARHAHGLIGECYSLLGQALPVAPHPYVLASQETMRAITFRTADEPAAEEEQTTGTLEIVSVSVSGLLPLAMIHREPPHQRYTHSLFVLVAGGRRVSARDGPCEREQAEAEEAQR